LPVAKGGESHAKPGKLVLDSPVYFYIFVFHIPSIYQVYPLGQVLLAALFGMVLGLSRDLEISRHPGKSGVEL
jgi:hypothetical protein